MVVLPSGLIRGNGGLHAVDQWDSGTVPLESLGPVAALGSGAADVYDSPKSALNATQNGYLTAYAAGTADPDVSLLIYDGVMTCRDRAYVPLSSTGQMTITNHGTEPVDIEVVTRGYFMTPTATPLGTEYAPVGPSGPVTVYGTGTADAQIGANSSVTFQVAGAAGLPATGSSR